MVSATGNVDVEGRSNGAEYGFVSVMDIAAHGSKLDLEAIVGLCAISAVLFNEPFFTDWVVGLRTWS